MSKRRSWLGRFGALAGAIGGAALTVAALPWLRGDDPARSVLRARLADGDPDPAAIAAVRSQLDLATNPIEGAVNWLAGAATGDLGRSWVDGAPVRDVLIEAAGVSASLAGAASTVAIVVALALVAPVTWTASSSRPRGAGASRLLAAGAAALPEFVVAAVLLTIVAVRWRIAPVAGWFGPSYLVLPALALGVPTGGLVARLVGTAVDATAGEPWVRTWQAVGCGRTTLATAILRRACTVAVPQVALMFVSVIGGATVVEEIFAIPGVARLALHAALSQDLPLVQGCVLLLVLVGVAAGGTGIVVQRAILGPAGKAAGMIVPAPPAGRRVRWPVPAGIGAVLGAAILAGLLRDPYGVHLDRRLSAPSWAYPLGTDPVGRDVLAQFGHGALLTIGTAVAVSAAAWVVGLAVGLRGTTARIGAADVVNALPPVLVGLVVAAILGPGLRTATTAALLVAWIPVAVHTRGLADEIRASGYHQAAVLAGASTRWILHRHLLPAVTGPALVNTLTRVPSVAITIASLSFLGLGVGQDTPEWGAQLASSLDYVERTPAAVIAPVVGLALLGVLAGFAPTEPRRRGV